ncbi:MAG TPA: HdeD family acid-resistance protein [Pyrinomonadaceae bacterium]|nr:HdeD family acid-resistance protein [Pyrinomonadaceae bacterium]
MNDKDNVNVAVVWTVSDTLAHNWWLLALRGLVAIIFGILAFIWPASTLLGLMILFGAFAFVNGILSLMLAAKAPKGYPRFGSLILGGILGIIAGVVTFFWPALTAAGLLILIAAWAILTGILEIVAAIRLRKEIVNEWLLALVGILSVIFGVLLLLQPAAGAVVLIWWIGAYALVFGILLLILAFRVRSWKNFASVAEAHA